MRTIAIMAITLAAVSLSGFGASAQYVGGSWCANYGGGKGGGTNCGFHSYDQCRAAISGNGGMCSRNQWSGSGDRDARRRQRD